MPRYGFSKELFARRQFLSQFTCFIRLAPGLFLSFAFRLRGFPGFFRGGLPFGFRRRLALGLLGSGLALSLGGGLTLGLFIGFGRARLASAAA